MPAKNAPIRLDGGAVLFQRAWHLPSRSCGYGTGVRGTVTPPKVTDSS